MTTAIISLQWNPLRLYANSTGRVEVENVFEIYFAVHTIFTKIWENDFTFSKIDFKTEYEKKYLNGQKTTYYFMLDMPQVKFR
jgi:hypothetical protein